MTDVLSRCIGESASPAPPQILQHDVQIDVWERGDGVKDLAPQKLTRIGAAYAASMMNNSFNSMYELAVPVAIHNDRQRGYDGADNENVEVEKKG